MLARLLLALGSAVLLMGLLEGGARIVEGHPPREIELEAKALGSIRIGVVGGSTAYGTPLPEVVLHPSWSFCCGTRRGAVPSRSSISPKWPRLPPGCVARPPTPWRSENSTLS